MMDFIKRQPPVRIIAVGFALVILLGSVLLSLPFSVREGVELRYVDALYTSTSAVCVTGLVSVDAFDTFTPVGQVILALLMQIGGLGVTSIGAGVIILVGKKMDLKSRNLVRESMNFGSGRSVRRFVKNVFFTTLIIEAIGAVLSFCVFIQDYPLSRAAWISIFHSIAAFNNSGFDILGGFQSISAYKGDVFLNIVTAVLIFLGGIGFLVIKEVGQKRFKWKKFSMHTKVVLLVSAVLTVVGTVLLKLANDITWLGAFFMSVSARTAGFATYSLGGFTNAGLMVMLALMIIGASPGSTGGGIKTSTLFVLLQGIRSSATNRSEKAFKYRIPRDAFKKAAVITLFALSVIVIASFVMCMLEPHIAMSDILVEITSAMGTVGLSTGITPTLSAPSKLLTALIMYIGRLGPWTIVTMWSFSREERISYPEGNIAIG